jgi:hypothetical protein
MAAIAVKSVLHATKITKGNLVTAITTKMLHKETIILNMGMNQILVPTGIDNI